MVKRIERDRGRFEDIVRGRIKQDLRKHITRGELIGKQGDQLVSIPLPRMEVPRFRYGRNDRGGGRPGSREGGRSAR